MKKIYLASGSPRRKELLQSIGLDFEIVSNDFEEIFNIEDNPVDIVKNLSLGKAKNASNKLEKGIVIGADTLVFFNEKILGKPKDKKEAINMLRSLSNQIVEVYTGVALVDSESNNFLLDYGVSKLKIKNLTENEILNYVATEEPLDKAGSFGPQNKGALIIEKIEGDYSNILGLPLLKLSEMLKKFGVNCL